MAHDSETAIGGGKARPGQQLQSSTLHPTPYTLHPTPHTLHPNPKNQTRWLTVAKRRLVEARRDPGNSYTVLGFCKPSESLVPPPCRDELMGLGLRGGGERGGEREREREARERERTGYEPFALHAPPSTNTGPYRGMCSSCDWWRHGETRATATRSWASVSLQRAWYLLLLLFELSDTKVYEP